MKKLFVLFLLVALVPFTVGCGLFGDNDDTSPVDLPTLSATVTGIATPANIRGNLVAFQNANYTVVINGVRLSPVAADPNGAGWDVTFQALTDAATLATINASAFVTVEIQIAGAPTTYTVKVPGAAMATAKTITLPISGVNIDATNTVVGTEGKVAVVEANAVTILSATNNGAEVATTQSGAVPVNNLTPAFVVTFDKDVVLQDITFDVGVKNVNKTEQDLTMNDILVTAVNGNTKQANVAVHGKTLSAGQTYQISVRWIKAGTMIVGSKTFFIKTAQ